MKTYERYTGRSGNGARGARSIDDVERDVGDIRSEMSSTLRAIESKLSGGDMMGQLLGQFRGEGADSGELLRNLGNVARANPVPVALIATGLGAMLFAGQEGTTGVGQKVKQRARDRVERYRAEHASTGEEGGESGLSDRARGVRESASEKARRLREGAGQRAHGLRETTSERLHQAREGTGRRISSVQSRARSSGEHARERMRAGSDRARHGVQTASHQGRRMIQDEPLILVGLGVALGAAVAASMPIVRETRERSRRERAEARSDWGEGRSEWNEGGRDQEQGEASSVRIEEVQVITEEPSGFSWQEEPKVGPDVTRPESPEDPSDYR